MLPQLGKKRSDYFSQSRSSKFGQPLQDSKNQSKVKSMSAKKVRSGGGFMKSNMVDEDMGRPTQTQQFAQQENMIRGFICRNKTNRKENKSLPEKTGRRQEKVTNAKQYYDYADQEAATEKDRPNYDFEKIVRKQMQLQGYREAHEENNQNFDYLTNPKLKGGEQEPQEIPVTQKPLIIEAKPYDIEAGVQKLQKFYQNSLKKKFQRRQVFPHQACKRKTPKLYITQKTNALSKYGRAQNEAEHIFRVITKQITPQEIYPTIPNFPVVRDNLSKNIVAYLGDYKPFIDKTKQSETLRKNKQEQQGKGQSEDNQSQSEIQTKSQNIGVGKPFNVGDLNKIQKKDQIV